MRTAIVFVCIAIVFLLVFYNLFVWQLAMSGIYVYLYNTHYVFSFSTVFAYLVFILATFFFLGGTIGTRLKNKTYWIPLGLLLTIEIGYFIKNSDLYF